MNTLLPATIACTMTLATVQGQTTPPQFRCAEAPPHHILASHNRLAAGDFYQQLAATKGNVLFAPYSISSALAMAASGARGDTEAEMRKALHFDLPQTGIPNASRELNAAILKQAGDKGPKLHIANALCQTGGIVNPDYQKLLKESYSAEIFSGDLTAINDWVKNQTEGKINKILDQLDPNSACVLLNAIYFKGDWSIPFNKKLTTKTPFHLVNGTTTEVEMMQKKEDCRLFTIPGARLLEIPYSDYTMSMVILLPDAVDGLATLEEKCTPYALSNWLQQLQQTKPSEIQIFLPKFKLETSYDLVPTCRALGMTKAFDSATADFSGILGKPGDIHLSQIKHKAVIEVNESGTEAMAIHMLTTAWGEGLEPQVFRADHPFLFLIREHATNSILFMGRLSDPKGNCTRMDNNADWNHEIMRMNDIGRPNP